MKTFQANYEALRMLASRISSTSSCFHGDVAAGWLTYSARLDPDHTAETAVTIDPTTVKVQWRRRP